ncbi:MAG: deoxyribonuclease II family protein [Rhizomicrobium sp.]
MRAVDHFHRISEVIARMIVVVALLAVAGMPAAADANGPVPLLKSGQPVDWWFMFKLNSAEFPGCGGDAHRVCLFGGDVQTKGYTHFGQQFVYASSANHVLQKGNGCAGDSVNDPLGATFNEVYNGHYHYVVWNDQFYDDPKISGGGNWGHSKGMLAWDDNGDGLVLQVTTPSWPAAASAVHPRQTDGNTLGCVTDNDVEVSQHFFALKLTKDDVVKVLQALANASVVTDPSVIQITDNGGPNEISSLVAKLGEKITSKTVLKVRLSSGVMVMSKPSDLLVPPWQLVSAELGGIDLRVATWWMAPAIYSTTTQTKLTCWREDLGAPGAVAIATSGEWNKTVFGLQGGNAPDRNHAKIGVSTSGNARYTIFGDMNQQGTVTGIGTGPKKCAHSQNQRGGLFFVMDDDTLWTSVTSLVKGDTAPTKAP